MPRSIPSIFIHGLESSGRGFKGKMFKKLFPGLLAPDFHGALEERMARLRPLLALRADWIIIGSSFGGLMAAIYAREIPARVKKLILLAPALLCPEFASDPLPAISVPADIYHGTKDAVIPLEPVRILAGKVFSRLTFHVVDDDHILHKTVGEIDWPALFTEH